MTLTEMQQTISREIGIPEYLLTDTTPQAVLQRARAILAQHRAEEARRPQSTRDQFAAWYYAQQGMDLQAERQRAENAVLDRIAEALRVEAGGYPIVRDGGGVAVHLGDCRSAAQQLGGFLNDRLAQDLRTDAAGWTHLGPLP